MKRAFSRLIIFGVLGGSVFGCGAIEPASLERWRLVNPKTDPPEPIGGATILITYRGASQGLVHTSPTCSRAVVAESDADGWFRFPPAGRDVDLAITAYKRGYRMRRAGEGYLSDLAGKSAYLVPIASAETHQDRIREFSRFNGAATCSQIGERSQPLADFRKAVLPELRELARTEEDARLIRNFELAIEYQDQSKR